MNSWTQLANTQECMDTRTHGRMDAWTHGRMDTWTQERMGATGKHQVPSLFPSFSATSSWKEPGNEATVMGEEKELNG